MSIYKDDLPKNCGECPFNYDSIGCMAFEPKTEEDEAELRRCLNAMYGDLIKNAITDRRFSKCPLATTQSLKQQVREEVVEEIKKRLAELKQKAIVPKYQVGQTLFRIDFGAIVPFLVNEIYVHIKADKTISIQYFDYVGLVIEENELFATKEETEQKLTKIKGEKDAIRNFRKTEIKRLEMDNER